ncbi:MAG: hypothetical protein MUO85_00030 [candidate division Zixibacteria bacterium]|nr:hypothetical protein [candidate division Zixibacteria bacterium]
MYRRCLTIAVCLFLFISAEAKGACVKPDETKQSTYLYKTAKQLAIPNPNMMQRVHRVGRMAMCVTNWGFFGSSFSTAGTGECGSDQKPESEGGCFNPNPDEEKECAPSFEYPFGSNLNYLYLGSLWLGAIVPAAKPEVNKSLDTVVSVGADGWQRIEELYPDGPKPRGEIIERTTRSVVPNMDGSINPCYSSDAVSEQDIIAVYTDTLTPVLINGPGGMTIDPVDNRDHQPIGLQIIQKSYSWSYNYAEDFILIDYWIKNIGEDSITDMYMGLYIDGDVLHEGETGSWGTGAKDDICGFKKEVYDPGSKKMVTINTAWIADNDGFPEPSNVSGSPGYGIDDGDPPTAFNQYSCTSVTGTRIVRKPPARSGTTLAENFNWWVGNHSNYPEDDVNSDWGPWLEKNMDKWESIQAYGRVDKYSIPAPYGSGIADVLGTPGGDITKYFIMSNGEWDPNQFYANDAAHLASLGFMAPSSHGEDIANGYDTRYLFSFGPLKTLQPDDSIPLTIAYLAGENFHTIPKNYASNLKSAGAYHPEEYDSNLNFNDFGLNATWASKVYDNWIDWDGDGITDSGDGVPDFKGPPPPAAPGLKFETANGTVKIKWNGKNSEKSVDDFTRKEDFEGYKIYINQTGFPDDYILVVSFDKIDYNLYYYKPALQKYVHLWPSVTIDSLKEWFGSDFGDNALAYFDSTHCYTYTESYKKIAVDTISKLDTLRIGPVEDDTTFNKFYFTPSDWNLIGLDSFKVYKAQIDSGLVTPESSKYYEYEYSFSGLLPSKPTYFAVSAFDYGDPQTGLGPLESSKMINATPVYPVSSPQEVKAQGKKVVVYPNPYRADGNYQELGFEDPDKSGWTEFDRRIWFVNLPVRCKIRIYTLDGDLVAEIEHDASGLVNQTTDYWNMISRNTQTVVSGIYLFSVEDLETGQNQIGKFVIIK